MPYRRYIVSLRNPADAEIIEVKVLALTAAYAVGTALDRHPGWDVVSVEPETP